MRILHVKNKEQKDGIVCKRVFVAFIQDNNYVSYALSISSILFIFLEFLLLLPAKKIPQIQVQS